MLDWNRISELQEEIGPDAFHEVVALFLEEVDASLARLGRLTEPREVEGELHFIKGCALNFGFRGLADLTARGEMAARAGDLSGISVATVADAYGLSKREFLAALSDPTVPRTGAVA